jgi:hypothetical protein
MSKEAAEPHFMILSQPPIVVSDYRVDDRVSFPDRGKEFFFLALASRPVLRPSHPPVQWVPGVLSPGVKSSRGFDADHSHLSSAEVNNE